MANYLLVFKGGGSMAATDEERQQVLAQWGQWYDGLGQAVVDGGKPFGSSASVAADGTASQGAASGLTGYAIITADNLDSATAAVKGCPILAAGGLVEVYETFDVM